MDDFFTPRNIVLGLAGLILAFFLVATLPHTLDLIF